MNARRVPAAHHALEAAWPNDAPTTQPRARLAACPHPRRAQTGPRPRRPAVVLTSNPAINYTVVDTLRPMLVRMLAKARGKDAATFKLTLWYSFLIGVIAKSITTVITFPVIRLKVLGQAKSDGRSTGQLVRDLVATEGLGGFYVGMGPQIGTAALKAGLLLAAKDQIQAVVAPVVAALLAVGARKRKAT